jgi:arginine/ornithine transport system substrate-binding protein
VRRALLILALAATVALPAAAQGRKLRIGVEGAYPPFSERGADGQLKGFEIELAQAFCRQMQRDCELVQTEFDALIPSLQARKIDAIVASLSITAERRRTIAFSDKYYSSPQRFFGPAAPALDTTPAGMKGKKIGVQSATIHERFVTNVYPQSQVLRYQTQDQIYLDLKTGRLDAGFADSVAVQYGFLKTPAGQGMGQHGPVFNEPKWFGDGVGVGLRKADAKTLGTAFNAAIAAVRASGEYQRIAARYFDFDIYGR